MWTDARRIAKLATTFLCTEIESRAVLPRMAMGDLEGNGE